MRGRRGGAGRVAGAGVPVRSVSVDLDLDGPATAGRVALRFSSSFFSRMRCFCIATFLRLFKSSSSLRVALVTGRPGQLARKIAPATTLAADELYNLGNCSVQRLHSARCRMVAGPTSSQKGSAGMGTPRMVDKAALLALQRTPLKGPFRPLSPT